MLIPSGLFGAKLHQIVIEVILIAGISKRRRIRFSNTIQSDLDNQNINLWMYGFNKGEFASDIQYTTSPTINIDTFSSDFGGGRDNFLIKTEATILYKKIYVQMKSISKIK